MRAKAVEVFVDHCIKKDSPDAFEVFRLVLPQSDRRVYPGVSQYRLIYLVVVVVRRLVAQFPTLAGAVGGIGGGIGGGIRGGADGDFYSRLFRWRDKDDLALALGEPSELSEFLKEKVYDAFCGDHSKSEAERDLARRMGRSPSPTAIQVNDKLDEFSDASRRHCVEQQVDILAWLMQRLSPRQMMWLTRMLLKRTRVWISERDVLEQAPWGEGAVKTFFEQGRSFEELLGEVGGGGIPAAVDGNRLGLLAGELVDEGGAVEKARSTRRPQVVLGNIDDAFRYMERRFKPGNYSPMSVIVDAVFDGFKVRICRVQGTVRIEFSEDERSHGMTVCEDTVVVEAMARWEVCGGGRGDGDVDFDIEADIVAWNTMKKCAEPRFILEALMEADRGLEEGRRVSSDSQPMHVVPRGHLEILVFVTDVVSVGEESMIDQYLQVRQESLAYFGGKCWGVEQGFRVPVRVVPLVPGSTQMAGTSVSDVFDHVGAIQAFQAFVQHLGARGVMLRAPEVEWSTIEKMARVQVMNSMGLSIINCVVMGYWRENQGDAEGRVSHWLLGVAEHDGGSDRASSSSDDCTTAILKLRNHLHMMDEMIALESLGTAVAPVPDPTGLYECSSAAVQSAQSQTLMSVAGSLLPPGNWSSFPLVLVPTLLGLAPCGSAITSIDGMRRVAEEKRMRATREKVPSVRFRDRTVASRFIPCHTPVTTSDAAESGPLRDFTVHFVNHSTEFVAATTRYQDKRRCEELVQTMGGTVSQNYCQRVNLVIAGRSSAITNKFREMDVDIMTVAWLERLASAVRDVHGSPLTALPAFLPEDYLPEWDPVEDHRKKINRNFLGLFTTVGSSAKGPVSEAKRFKSMPTTGALATTDVAGSCPLPLAQQQAPRIKTQVHAPVTTDPIPPVSVEATAWPITQPGKAARPTQIVTGTDERVHAPFSGPETGQSMGIVRANASTTIAPVASPPETAPTPPPAVPAPQATEETPSTSQRPGSLKERASKVIAMGSSIPSPASPVAKKLSLRDRAKRLGLGTKK